MYWGRLAKPCQVFTQLCWVVTGGPGSFVVTIRERKDVKEAIRTKLVLEVASFVPEQTTLLATEKQAPVNCMIGDNGFRDR
jgi:phosphoserine phosphatase